MAITVVRWPLLSPSGARSTVGEMPPDTRIEQISRTARAAISWSTSSFSVSPKIVPSITCRPPSRRPARKSLCIWWGWCFGLRN